MTPPPRATTVLWRDMPHAAQRRTSLAKLSSDLVASPAGSTSRATSKPASRSDAATTSAYRGATLESLTRSTWLSAWGAASRTSLPTWGSSPSPTRTS